MPRQTNRNLPKDDPRRRNVRIGVAVAAAVILGRFWFKHPFTDAYILDLAWLCLALSIGIIAVVWVANPAPLELEISYRNRGRQATAFVSLPFLTLLAGTLIVSGYAFLTTFTVQHI